jgi:transcriptional regulator with XRE-family HTH domain
VGITRNITLVANTLGDYVRQHRQIHGLSRRRMARQLDHTESWLRHVEDGRIQELKAKDRDALCRVLGLEPDVIAELQAEGQQRDAREEKEQETTNDGRTAPGSRRPHNSPRSFGRERGELGAATSSVNPLAHFVNSDAERQN